MEQLTGQIVGSKAMQNRTQRAGVIWLDEGSGYYSGFGSYVGVLAYVALPENHWCIGKNCYELYPDVNGGLTFGVENVFGWDYSHTYNHIDYLGDMSRALKYFRRMNNPLWRLWFSLYDKFDLIRYRLRLRLRRLVRK